jgi:formamidopyrimidine-DNA glycosylase
MPELPEVETMARTLASRVVGREVKSFRLYSSSLVKHEHSSDLKAIFGRRVEQVGRRGKIVVITFKERGHLLFHPKMTGQFLFCPLQQPVDKHTHFCLTFKGYRDELRFRDARKFGYMCFEDQSKGTGSRILDGLGPEPLDLDCQHFKALFSSRRARLKSLLLDQNFLAGVGNIYADEILFQAGIRPFRSADTLSEREVCRLWRAMLNILQEAIVHRGTSIRNYVDAEGRRGEFQALHKVYGRTSLPCLICGSSILKKKAAGRSTHFCPNCQK